jgi:hypothetical protein
MKVWLNNLKEGDIFYHVLLDRVCKCKHLGNAHNMNFKMSRIKFEILDDETIFNEDLLGNIHEAFVNQYVYDDYESAEEAYIDDLKKELKSIKESIVSHKTEIENLEILIRENKAKQALFMLYKCLFDGIDIDDTLNQIDQRIKDLQLHLTIMETLKSCHDLVEATNFSSNDASDSFEENDLLDYDDTYEFSSYDFDDFYDE